MGHGDGAEIPLPAGLPPEGGDQRLHHIVDVAKLQLYTGVTDGDGQVVGVIVADGGDDGIVVGAAPFAEEIDEAVDQHLGSRLGAVGEEEVFACALAPSVGTVIAAQAGGLDGGGEHHGAGIAPTLQGVQEPGGEAEIALHELLRVLGTVHACQMEDEISLFAALFQKAFRGIQIVKIQLPDSQLRKPAVLAVADIFQGLGQIFSDKSGGTGDENVHGFSPWGTALVRTYASELP